MNDPGETLFYRVAVPLPLPEPLTYGPPEGWQGELPTGVRVTVPVGPRQMTGIVVGRAQEAPEGVRIRPITEILDVIPVLSEELLELARFTADYYLAPLGEVLRSFVPGDLEPWGHQRLRLTDRGALAVPRNPDEERVLEHLRTEGSARVGKLAGLVGSGLAEIVERFHREGKVILSGDRRRSGVRYRSAYELTTGDPEELEKKAGRSEPGRQVVRWLADLDRPATGKEITEAVGCGRGVVRRLEKLGIVRKFTEIRRLD
ncbi:MAG: hypothetical protein R3234_05810, partial [Thermoanaerobaculia bacterium]|nr:hypothetical protein [Thermoanaerobaculia bacterium]